ncbi:hypothetical protein [Nocardiopsis alba]|uniref:hypothetical protein n=1 Tax=Nocardiopsis alba TaxID=53437 RepID=UPI0033BEFD24
MNDDAAHHAGDAADMADTMATMVVEFGNDVSPLYAAAPEITGSVVDYDIEGNQRIHSAAASSRSLVGRTSHAGEEISNTDQESGADFSDLPVVSLPRELNF